MHYVTWLGLWVKVKCLHREEFVVVGWTDPEGSRPWLGALRRVELARRFFLARPAPPSGGGNCLRRNGSRMRKVCEVPRRGAERLTILADPNAAGPCGSATARCGSARRPWTLCPAACCRSMRQALSHGEIARGQAPMRAAINSKDGGADESKSGSQ